MTTPPPDLPSNVRGLPTRPPRAVFITADPLLAEHVAALDPRVHTTVLQQLPGTHPPQIPDTDGLLLITGAPTDLTAATTGIATITRTLYVGTNLDDAAVWSRSADLHAHDTLLLPEDDDRLATEITTQLGPAPSAALTPGPGHPPVAAPDAAQNTTPELTAAHQHNQLVRWQEHIKAVDPRLLTDPHIAALAAQLERVHAAGRDVALVLSAVTVHDPLPAENAGRELTHRVSQRLNSPAAGKPAPTQPGHGPAHPAHPAAAPPPPKQDPPTPRPGRGR